MIRDFQPGSKIVFAGIEVPGQWRLYLATKILKIADA